MGGDAGDMLKQVAGYGVGALGALTSLKGGGLQNYFINRQRMIEDPAFRATLVDAPFTAGVFGLGRGEAPTGGQPVAAPGDGTPVSAGAAAPGDVRYLPAGGHWYPAAPPLDYTAQAKAEQDRANMIGLTSSDPVIRGQSKSAIGVPLAASEAEALVRSGNTLVGQSGPGSQVQFKTGFGGITVGSPYMAGNYMSQAAAEDAARKTGQVAVPSNIPGQYKVEPQQRLPAGEFRSQAEAAASAQPNEKPALTGRKDVDGTPTWENRKVEPTGVPSLESRPAVQPQKPAAKPAPAPPPPSPATPAPPPDTAALPSQGAPPAPAPEAAAPPPPHEVVIMRPDGSFAPAPKPAAPAPAPRAPRAEATPATAPPLLAAAGPSSPFAFPGVSTPPVAVAAAPGPVMVARAAPPPYQLVPGAELSGVASGAPPAPAEERGAPPPPVPPAPTGAVPWQQETPGQAAEAMAPSYPSGMPAGTQRVTESRPLPGKEGGTVSYEETTPAGLDFDKRRALMEKDIEQRYGKIADSKDLAGKAVVRGVINDLLNAYPPEQRGQYLGYVTPYVKEFYDAKGPMYQNFLQMNAQIRDAAIAAGIPERAVANFPTGTEHTAADYESRLRGAANMIDKMMAAPGVFESMHPADLTPAKLQRVTDQYLSGPAPVHFGAYPWDEKTGNVIPTPTTTTTSPGPTTTTLYPVDRRYTVQPSPR